MILAHLSRHIIVIIILSKQTKVAGKDDFQKPFFFQKTNILHNFDVGLFDRSL